MERALEAARKPFGLTIYVTTLASAVVLPAVACWCLHYDEADILEWLGTLYQLSAVGMAAYQLNNLNVTVFKGPGFLKRLGFGKLSVGYASGHSTTSPISVSMEAEGYWNPTDDIEEKVRRLEMQMAALTKDYARLHRRLSAETSKRQEADSKLRSEFLKKLGSVEGRLRDATLGDALQWPYTALILAFVGTVLSTFNQGIGGWF